jgi:hypothetical protein
MSAPGKTAGLITGRVPRKLVRARHHGFLDNLGGDIVERHLIELPAASPDNVLMRAQVAIIGVGPAGSLLGQLLHKNGGETQEGFDECETASRRAG